MYHTHISLTNFYNYFYRLQPNMKCIVFVNRIVTARSLSYILQNLKFLLFWKCHFLVGVHSGLKSMSRKTMKNILEKFRTGEVTLLLVLIFLGHPAPSILWVCISLNCYFYHCILADWLSLSFRHNVGRFCVFWHPHIISINVCLRKCIS